MGAGMEVRINAIIALTSTHVRWNVTRVEQDELYPHKKILSNK